MSQKEKLSSKQMCRFVDILQCEWRGGGGPEYGEVWGKGVRMGRKEESEGVWDGRVLYRVSVGGRSQDVYVGERKSE